MPTVEAPRLVRVGGVRVMPTVEAPRLVRGGGLGDYAPKLDLAGTEICVYLDVCSMYTTSTYTTNAMQVCGMRVMPCRYVACESCSACACDIESLALACA